MNTREMFRTAIVAAAIACAGTLHAAEITLKSAWMRPAAADTPATRAYVDVESRGPLTLVGASTPLAKRVEIVRVLRIDDPTSEEVVASLPVEAGIPRRLAFRGDHLRLLEVTKDVGNGDLVPLTLEFQDAAGTRTSATTEIVVRGILRPQ